MPWHALLLQDGVTAIEETIDAHLLEVSKVSFWREHRLQLFPLRIVGPGPPAWPADGQLLGAAAELWPWHAVRPCAGSFAPIQLLIDIIPPRGARYGSAALHCAETRPSKPAVCVPHNALDPMGPPKRWGFLDSSLAILFCWAGPQQGSSQGEGSLRQPLALSRPAAVPHGGAGVRGCHHRRPETAPFAPSHAVLAAARAVA